MDHTNEIKRTAVPVDVVLEQAGSDRLEDAFVRNGPAARRLAYFLTGDPDHADDLCQEAFVRVAARFGHLRTPDQMDAYLRRTIVNLHTSSLRRRRVERSWAARHVQRPPIVELNDGGERDDIWSRLHRLPSRQRAALVLRFYEDLSERETAEVLGCTERAVNSLIARGLAALREDLRSQP